jgi:hypothetical protein
MRNGFVGALPEKPALDFMGGFVRSLQMHRSRRSLKDPDREQDAPLAREPKRVTKFCDSLPFDSFDSLLGADTRKTIYVTF